MKKTAELEDDEDTGKVWNEIKDVAAFAAEKRAVMAQTRAQAHAEVDRVFDACLQAFEADIVQIRKDAAAGAIEAPARH